MKSRIITRGKLFGMILGVIVLSGGIAIFRQSGMGNDPCNAMLFRIAELSRFPISRVIILANVLYFVLELLFGRTYIGIGTFVNWFGCGYAIAFFCSFFGRIFEMPDTFFMQVLWILAGILVMSLGISLYQTANIGISPYDCLALLILNHTRLPYFLCRVITDGCCALICWRLGGLLGVGTLICTFGLGPFIAFFNKYVSVPLIGSRPMPVREQ